MKILHAIGYIGKAQGGPVQALCVLANAQAESGHTVRIVHTGRLEDGESVAFSEKVEVLKANSVGPVRYSWNWQAIALAKHFNPDVIHAHGLWYDLSRRAHLLSKNRRIPLVIDLRGMLQKML